MAEHLSEAFHDREAMKREVMEVSNAFHNLRESPPAPARSDALTPMVSDDYAEVGSEAGASDKSVLLSSPAREQEAKEREIRVIDNYTALETGSVTGTLPQTSRPTAARRIAKGPR